MTPQAAPDPLPVRSTPEPPQLDDGFGPAPEVAFELDAAVATGEEIPGRGIAGEKSPF